MLKKIIAVSVQNRFLVLVLALLAGLGGIYAMLRMPIDAIPDLSGVQVILLTEHPGQAPQVVEDQVTYPLATAMLSVPQAQTVRGYSFFGLSFVYIIFDESTDLYWARSRVLEQLNYVSARLPSGVTPTLGPDATSVGWVFEYVLDGGNRYDLQQLRSLQDWFLRYELMSLPNVAEVASIGGFVKQYQVEVDPNKLFAFGVTLAQVRAALQRSNSDVGGRLFEMGETEFMVRGLGYIQSIRDVENTPVGVDPHGTPVLIHDIARVQIGPELRRGLADWNGEGEVVGGIVVMRTGSNALATIRAVKQKLAALQRGLPEGVEVRTAYDRSGLILRALATLKTKLVEESLIVALVTLLFLLHLRSALVVIITLPLGILIAFLVMYHQGLNANIMSLSGIAIAIGAMVDGAVVMIENAHKHLERDLGQKDRWRIITDASKEVGPALFYSLLIITLSFLPVFALEAEEGALFKPLAFTKTFAMAAAALLSITVVPVLMGYLIRGRILPEHRNPVNRILLRMYRPVVGLVLRHRAVTLGCAFLLLCATLYPIRQLGSEFMPPLNEGDLLYMPTTDPGISVTKARELLQQTDKIIASFPEVAHVFGKVGRAETATDPAPLSMIESTITLKPEHEWREGMTVDRLIEEMDEAIRYPGLSNAWTMPIKTRLDMLATGIKTPVGVKIMGPDLAVLSDLGERVAGVLRRVPGTASAYPDRTLGGKFLDYRIKREEAGRYGMSVGDVQDVILSGIGGINVTQTVEGLERYPVNVRYSRELRDHFDELGRVLISTPAGVQIPLSYVADFSIVSGPSVIKSENARTTSWVYVDIRDTDLGTYVHRARAAVESEVSLPAGYSMVWSGQYEYMVRAEARLRIVVPLTAVIIFLLLYLNFRSVPASLIVMLSLPFSVIGGVWLLYLLQYELSVAVGVGFIALAGVAAEVGIIMLTYLNQAFAERVSNGQMRTLEDLMEAILQGAAQRIRPVCMTVAATMAGLLPIMWALGAGSQVMKRIAAPMVGGMVSMTILSLVVIPTLYFVWKSFAIRRAARSQ